MNQRTVFDAARLLVYALGVLVVVTVYLIIPLMITLSPFLETYWGRLLAAVGLLTLLEAIVSRILKKTSKKHEEYCAK
jgi:formate hydrogenlyase subunit 3/multisubunit Na+/H+ antiporter MnhD subunit